MKLRDICQKANINCPEHLENIEIEGITSNSKRVKENYLFFCLDGTKKNGHHYIDDALIRGAVAVVIENESYAFDRSITVDNTRSALAKAMNAFCGDPVSKLKFIGITGTNGKTSVSIMIKNIFDQIKIPCEVIGTLNCSSFSQKHDDLTANFTTPDPEELYPQLRRISDAGIEFVVMETSSHALKLKKLDPINFEIGIFTNLTEDHLDFHYSMEDYFNSKFSLFERCKLGIINIDDEYGKRIADLAPCEIKTCSFEQNADYLACEMKNLGGNGTEYTMKTVDSELSLLCCVPGEFSVMNSMQASATACELNIDRKYIKQSFENFQGVSGRLEKLEIPKDWGFAAFIDYAHTPDALAKILQTARSINGTEGRVIVLFGCGGDREKEKRRIMGEIAVELADFAVITSDNPRSENPNEIIKDILSGIKSKKNFIVIPDRKQAIEYALTVAREGDILLLAGKGHENYEINANGRSHFDEREVVCETIKNLRRRNEL